MKTLLLENQITNQPVLDSGILLLKQYLSTIQYVMDIKIQVINKQFHPIPFSNDVNNNGFLVNPAEIQALSQPGYDITFLVYDAKKVVPPPTNPGENGNILQMSCQWYDVYPQVFADYFLHELCHYYFLKSGKKDLTHLNNNSNLDPVLYDKLQVGQMQAHNFYLYLLTTLKPYWETVVPEEPTLYFHSPLTAKVKELQTILKLKVDGDFGKITLQAVKDFQKSRGLLADGVVGSKTWTELKKKPAEISKWKLSAKMEPIAQNFLHTASLKGFDIRITSGIRTQQEQDALYAQGRTKPGKIVTWTKNSRHIGGNAFDICFNGNVPYPSNDILWKSLAELGKSLGLKPGYYFKPNQDKPHFEV